MRISETERREQKLKLKQLDEEREKRINELETEKALLEGRC